MSNNSNEGRFSVWPAQNRRGPNDPTHNGKITLSGVEYWLSVWFDPNPQGNRPQITGSIGKPVEQRQAPQQHGYGGGQQGYGQQGYNQPRQQSPRQQPPRQQGYGNQGFDNSFDQNDWES